MSTYPGRPSGRVEVDERGSKLVIERTLDAAVGDVGPGWEFYADRHHAALNDNAMPDWLTDGYEELLGPHYSGL